MTQSTRQIMKQLNRVAVEFLIADLTVALTFLDVAETTGSEETRKRNHQNALAAHGVVSRLMPRVSPSAAERPTLEARLAELRGRLATLGYDLGSATENPSTT